MAKKGAPKRSPRKTRPGVVAPEVREFLQLLMRDKAVQARLKLKGVNLLKIARGLGYKFTKAQLMAGIREVTGSETTPFDPNTCTFSN